MNPAPPAGERCSMQGHSGAGHIFARLFRFFIQRIGKQRAFVLPRDVTDSSRILFVDSGEVTDLLFAAPMVNYFRSRYPNIRTTILVKDTNADLVRNIMKVNRMITYERKQLSFFSTDYMLLIKKLRRSRADLLILLSSRFSLDRYLLAFASGAHVRIGFYSHLGYPFINCEIRTVRDQYEGKKMISILHSIGLRYDGESEPVTLSNQEASHAAQLIHFRKPEKEYLMVGLDPSKGKVKHRVIPETIAYLANNLAGRRKVKFLVLTNPWDEKLSRSFSRDLKSEVLDLEPVDVNETVALLSQCDLFISGNTDLFHFAAALNVPTIGLFTKYDGARWIPGSARNVRIFKGSRGEKLSLKNFFSQVEEVLAARDGVAV